MKLPDTKFWKIAFYVGTLATALAIVPQLDGARNWITSWWRGIGAVELPGTYPGEVWRRATAEQYAWLQDDEWCYPSLRGFRSRFKVQDGTLMRQNEGSQPQSFKSAWVKVDVFISNKNVLRLRYINQDWPGDYIDFERRQAAEWRENQRNGHDDGSVSSGDKRLVLSCSRCRLSRDNITYSCNE